MEGVGKGERKKDTESGMRKGKEVWTDARPRKV